jgi:hypothetical protein
MILTSLSSVLVEFLPRPLFVDKRDSVHLELRISPRIFEKIRNGPNGIPSEAWGETDS